ncbi:MAG: chorismate-binding protein, partial [Gaiellaceae bacterium]
IRTIVSSPAGCSIGVGGAIVIDSDPDAEFSEMMLKGQALVRAVLRARCEEPALSRYGVSGDRRLESRVI